jgi:hypothetical protein
LEQIRWAADQPRGPAQTAARIAHVVTKTHEDDAKSEFEGMRRFTIQCREQYYTNNPDAIEPVKRWNQLAGAPQGVVEQVDFRLPPAERAAIDSFTKMTPAQHTWFVLPAAFNLAQLDAAIAGVQIPQEYQSMRVALDATRAARMAADNMPTAEQIYWVMFLAQLGQPTTYEKQAFLTLLPNKGETLIQWSTRYYIQMEATAGHVTITPEQLSLSYMAGVRIINSDLYHGIISTWQGGVVPAIGTCRDQVLAEDKTYREIAEHELLHAPRKAQPPQQQQPQARQHQAHFAETKQQKQQQFLQQGPQQHVHAQQQAPARQQQSLYCNLCNKMHPNGTCFLTRPDLALNTHPGWKPPTDPYLYDIYRLSCKKFNMNPQPQPNVTPAIAPQQSQRAPSVRPLFGNQTAARNQSFNATPPPAAYTNKRAQQNRPQANMAQQHVNHSAPASKPSDMHTVGCSETNHTDSSYLPGNELASLWQGTCFLSESGCISREALVTTRQMLVDLARKQEQDEAVNAIIGSPAIPNPPVSAAVGPAVLPAARVASVSAPKKAVSEPEKAVSVVPAELPLYVPPQRPSAPTAVGVPTVMPVVSKKPVVPRKPAPVPFATTAVPAGTPLSQLPEPQR